MRPAASIAPKNCSNALPMLSMSVLVKLTDSNTLVTSVIFVSGSSNRTSFGKIVRSF